VIIIAQSRDVAEYGRCRRVCASSFTAEKLFIGKSAFYLNSVKHIVNLEKPVILCNELREHIGCNAVVFHFSCTGSQFDLVTFLFRVPGIERSYPVDAKVEEFVQRAGKAKGVNQKDAEFVLGIKVN